MNFSQVSKISNQMDFREILSTFAKIFIYVKWCESVIEYVFEWFMEIHFLYKLAETLASLGSARANFQYDFWIQRRLYQLFDIL